ncbi:hypothetical protein GCK72_018134 [Caenorhabditis remanei]|uniref:7TM GPCR serpentine receptor class x (Srx) domain-containing protein n=1 Tax=Caenorhabditis remanei TaxID=31234 RepID=A0A6A5G997_CAERE|nr:hypothetical protein GCK72_018134 [Caenorhabditis remanei]KAF1751580.1 hypothetical protein GCK72_018134 [Caenorhabditis remanei]
MKLFLQTVLQDVLFFIDNFSTFFASQLIDHRFWQFICCTFVWQTLHVIDGFIMIMFNDRFSVLKSAFFPSSSVPVSSVMESSSSRTQPRRQVIAAVA